ncbi:hypothetical protein CF326_g2110 [Tilletia indica]|nr:hypothetical protein CF326_g2110 [Tilletia indica]
MVGLTWAVKTSAYIVVDTSSIMSGSSAPTESFVAYWRRVDVPHLTLQDRIYWVLQWAFKDPQERLYPGRTATMHNILVELVWVAKQYGQEPERPAPSVDEIIARARREDAERARRLNIHPIGRAIWGGSNTHRSKRRRHEASSHSAPTASTSNASVPGTPEDGEGSEQASQRSGSSASSVSQLLTVNDQRESPQHSEACDAQILASAQVSDRTLADFRRFRAAEYPKSASEDSVD